jgi:hypothetical protein
MVFGFYFRAVQGQRRSREYALTALPIMMSSRLILSHKTSLATDIPHRCSETLHRTPREVPAFTIALTNVNILRLYLARSLLSPKWRIHEFRTQLIPCK